MNGSINHISEEMIHNEEKLPDRESLPDQREYLRREEWDVLAVFDAMRYDMFDLIADDVEPIRTPTNSSTAGWLAKAWHGHDWSDITYVSANPMSDWVMENSNIDFDSKFDEYIRAWKNGSLFSDEVGVTMPGALTRYVKRLEPPIVTHYMQPHIPFVGDLTLRLWRSDEITQYLAGEDPDDTFFYAPVRNGHVSPELLRAGYAENAIKVYDEAQSLEDSFDKVCYTADHGECLGPDKWCHGKKCNRTRVVPWKKVE